jgi:hypothetical protein
MHLFSQQYPRFLSSYASDDTLVWQFWLTDASQFPLIDRNDVILEDAKHNREERDFWHIYIYIDV